MKTPHYGILAKLLTNSPIAICTDMNNALTNPTPYRHIFAVLSRH